ncbi:hypothetical protein [Spirosoma fluminis]
MKKIYLCLYFLGLTVSLFGQAKTIFNQGQVLRIGERIESPQKCFYLILQDDYNLVLYSSSGVALWDAVSAGKPAGVKVDRVVMEKFLTLYNGSQSVWRWNLRGIQGFGLPSYNGVYFALQDDGNGVIYNDSDEAIQSTKTNNKAFCLPPAGNKPSESSKLKVWEGTGQGIILRSPNQIFSLHLASTELILLEHNNVAWRQSFSRGVSEYNHNQNDPIRCLMQPDGNFVIYGSKRSAWSSRTNGTGATVLQLNDDGTLALYQSNGRSVNVLRSPPPPPDPPVTETPPPPPRETICYSLVEQQKFYQKPGSWVLVDMGYNSAMCNPLVVPTPNTTYYNFMTFMSIENVKDPVTICYLSNIPNGWRAAPNSTGASNTLCGGIPVNAAPGFINIQQIERIQR